MSQSILLQIARESIMEVLQAERLIARDELMKAHPILTTPMATFVTLYLDKEVRGCMGSLTQERMLIDDVIHNAKMAAFQDPRFAPLSTVDYLHTAIELSLLTQPQIVSFTDLDSLASQIVPQKDGLIIEYKDQGANFLPQVWHEHATFDAFFKALCQEAGVSTLQAVEEATIYSYQVESAFDDPLIK
ncbi:MAG TPA: AmmeMemoRadiSam system protein A [Helicobacteraceae bacterium]|nr:AmmeMemoRadiSam system protein A [Helicobacteraceae bacterium]